MIEEKIKELELPRYRLDQFNKQYYQEAVDSWDNLTTWPKELREKVKNEIPFIKLKDIHEFVSSDNRTIKILAKTELGHSVEAVLMRTNDRITICVSCMSGCSVGCEFCATGKLGLNQLLDTQEILDQIMYFKRKLKNTDEKITNIVYMGMGEPMLNLEPVINSIKILTDPEKLGMSARRITVSTVGYIENMRKFFDANTRTKLAISLHAPTQELREQLMPTAAKSNNLEELMNLLEDYEKETNKRITYEYILLKNINDTPEHAEQLSELLTDKLALVNLINFNPSPDLEFESSTPERIRAFQKILDQNGINNTLRYSMGQEIYGACGQLSTRVGKDTL
jgi:23S rRNA (adenine2503-C2)-methyltransferase